MKDSFLVAQPTLLVHYERAGHATTDKYPGTVLGKLGIQRNGSHGSPKVKCVGFRRRKGVNDDLS